MSHLRAAEGANAALASRTVRNQRFVPKISVANRTNAFSGQPLSTKDSGDTVLNTHYSCVRPSYFHVVLLMKANGSECTLTKVQRLQISVREISDDGWVAFESSHLGTFSGKLFVAPNTIDFSNVFGQSSRQVPLNCSGSLTCCSVPLVKRETHPLNCSELRVAPG